MSAAALSATPGLEDVAQYATPKELALASMLLSLDQQHVFAAWSAGHHEKKHDFFRQV